MVRAVHHLQRIGEEEEEKTLETKMQIQQRLIRTERESEEASET